MLAKYTTKTSKRKLQNNEKQKPKGYDLDSLDLSQNDINKSC